MKSISQTILTFGILLTMSGLVASEQATATAITHEATPCHWPPVLRTKLATQVRQKEALVQVLENLAKQRRHLFQKLNAISKCATLMTLQLAEVNQLSQDTRSRLSGMFANTQRQHESALARYNKNFVRTKQMLASTIFAEHCISSKYSKLLTKYRLYETQQKERTKQAQEREKEREAQTLPANKRSKITTQER